MSDPPASSMGLYADLLAGPPAKTSDGGTITSAPVRYNLKPQVSASLVPKKKDAALQFQPMVKRPQQKGKKSGAAHAWAASTKTTAATGIPTDTTKSAPPESSIEYWLEKGNDHNYVRPKPKWYRDKKNKKKQQKEQTREHNWDDVYDPMEPNNYRAYKGSEEQYRDICEWKDRLYFHARGVKPKQTPEKASPPSMNRMFAPPSLYDVALSNTEPTAYLEDATGEDAFARRARLSAATVPPLSTSEDILPPQPSSDHIPLPPPQSLQPQVAPPDVAAKQAEVLAKLAAVKAKIMASKPVSQPASVENLTTLPPPPSRHAGLGDFVPPQPLPANNFQDTPSQPRHTGLGSMVPSTAERSVHPSPNSSAGLGSSATYEPAQSTAPKQAFNVEDSAPAGTITRAPVRYAIPEQPQYPGPDDQPEAPNEEKPKSRKEGFGRRMLEKQGWKEGHGLGANSEGITTAIVAQAQKRKKAAGAEGLARNMGKIIGGKRRKVDGEESEPAMSNVIKLPGMLKGLDVKHEIEEKNLQQELGEWFDQNYGMVERVMIWREEQGGDNEVFIKFTNPISALKAVNTNDKLTFANNEVNASFYDASKFDEGEYA